MKATMSRDGRKRISFNVAFRMDADAIATHVTSSILPRKEDVTPVQYANQTMKKYSNKKLLELVKVEVSCSGDEISYYRIGDNDLHDYVAELAKRIEQRMFGGAS
jgi:hypothetical protein